MSLVFLSKMDAPRMPHKMKNVYADIDKHPRKPELGFSVLIAYEFGAKGGYSHCTTENNKWAREIWKKLYLDWNIEL
jgi:hypothetical protein